jgi:hypothetical protein
LAHVADGLTDRLRELSQSHPTCLAQVSNLRTEGARRASGGRNCRYGVKPGGYRVGHTPSRRIYFTLEFTLGALFTFMKFFFRISFNSTD